MAVSESIPFGTPTPILQNVVYALPAVLVQVATTVACQVSVDGVVWTALVSDTITAAAFIRCITANSIVIAKKASAGGASLTTLLSQSLSIPSPIPGRVIIYLDKNLAGKFRIRAMFPSGVSANIVVEP